MFWSLEILFKTGFTVYPTGHERVKEGKYVKTGVVVNKEHISGTYTFWVRILLVSRLHKCARLCDCHCLGFICCPTMKEMKTGERKHVFWKWNTSVLYVFMLFMTSSDSRNFIYLWLIRSAWDVIIQINDMRNFNFYNLTFQAHSFTKFIFITLIYKNMSQTFFLLAWEVL